MKGIGSEVFDSLVVDVAGCFRCLFGSVRPDSGRWRGNGG